eukprot:TRINITY_DN1320_c0_g1_i12.p2 TRINITY_DN1320_c0_g1~~TRINITY_DN1320_c0_g1_i12.p2  ORF type:complete len:253 (-),score=43.01 TRINITY_DN1320_c0_g1_i12:1594-2352(-)
MVKFLFHHRLLGYSFVQKTIYFILSKGFGNDGVWIPKGINDCFRFTKYEKDGHFNKHCDGSYVKNDDERSVYTVMIYLSEGFSGGDTVFYGVDKKSCNELHIRPRIGTALVFRQDTEHAGLPVVQGVKYILRTDIMFQRNHRHVKDKRAIQQQMLSDKNFLEMDRLYQKSIQYQIEGNPEASTESYLKAMEIQTRLFPSWSQEADATVFDIIVPMDIWLSIFAFLSVEDLVRCMVVCIYALERMCRQSVHYL